MSLIGCVDTLAEICIAGWAADDADLSQAVSVDIMINGDAIATVPCIAFRDDLQQAGIGDGRKGFQFDPGPHLKPGRNKVVIRFAGTDGVLPGGQGGLFLADRAAESENPFQAALQAYHQFYPEPQICDIASNVVPSPLFFANLRNLIDHQTNRPACIAIEFAVSDDAAAEIRGMLAAIVAAPVYFESVSRRKGESRRLCAFVLPQTGTTEPPPLLAHIHVPKCAGTSFRILLERCLGPRHLRLYVNDTYFVFTEDALRNRLLHDPSFLAFSSHHVRTFPRWLAGRRMLYVTFLRHPVQQFVSYMTHIQKHYAGINAPTLLASVPPDAPHLPLREFARWLLTNPNDIPFRENHTVKFFASHTASHSVDRLRAAKSALSDFFFVGIAERMEESVAHLRSLLGASGVHLALAESVPVENTSAEYRDNLDWITPEDEVGAMLLRSLELDQQLYDWSLARFLRTGFPTAPAA